MLASRRFSGERTRKQKWMINAAASRIPITVRIRIPSRVCLTSSVMLLHLDAMISRYCWGPTSKCTQWYSMKDFRVGSKRTSTSSLRFSRNISRISGSRRCSARYSGTPGVSRIGPFPRAMILTIIGSGPRLFRRRCILSRSFASSSCRKVLAIRKLFRFVSLETSRK